MKKAFKALVILLCVGTFCIPSTFGQKKFKGIITYAITYGGTIDAATAAMQPKITTLAIYENKQKSTTSTQGVTFDEITDGDNKSKITLLDLMGQKVYFKTSTTEIEAEIAENPEPEIKYSEETKSVAGYNCKKADYIMQNEDGETISSVVYYTEELGGELLNYGGQFNKLKGVPLEYTMTTPDGKIITFAASEVKRGKVKDTDFLIPADYVELSAEEKQQLLNQLKGQ
ncbi:MAG: hypothetical protein PHR81_10830 [Bacteroidales bacterium]|jgi:GLPGLI family protein|nr:hypothetical protein [Bacteroidales bacterium]MDD4215296.1 hypothetical protein [Bacteroidales bacterium]